MAIFYKRQGELERMAAKNGAGCTSKYRSDQRAALYGGRGGVLDELHFIRNNAATGVDTRLSDAWVAYVNGLTDPINTGRYDQAIHDFSVNGAYP